jgi:hypothetical protein
MSQDFASSNPFRRSVLSRSDVDTGRIDAVHVASVLDSTPRLVGERETVPTGGDHNSTLSDSSDFGRKE